MKLHRKCLLISAAAVATTLSIVFTSVSLNAAEKFSPFVDEKGNISFPQGFRTSLIHLGSWFVPTGGASGFHDVYTEKESVEAYPMLNEN